VEPAASTQNKLNTAVIAAQPDRHEKIGQLFRVLNTPAREASGWIDRD
jgi:hypothetical protein